MTGKKNSPAKWATGLPTKTKTTARAKNVALKTEGIIAQNPPDSQHFNGNKTATAKQVVYLQSLRTRFGLSTWNAVKRRLKIDTPGTFNLTKYQAQILINELLKLGGK